MEDPKKKKPTISSERAAELLEDKRSGEEAAETSAVPAGPSSRSMQDRREASAGVHSEGAKRARAESATQKALVREKVQPTVMTADRVADDYAKKRGLKLGIGNRGRYMESVKKKVGAGKSPEAAAAEAAREMGLE